MEKAKRQSNFELLRIFAMIMIILHHIQVHGSQVLLTADSGYFAQPIIYLRLLVFEIGVPLGSIGNGLFIMISGYFMNANGHIDTGKIAKKLLLQLGFAVTALLIAYSVWITYFKSETLSLSMIAIGKFNSGWWFIGYYFSIIVLAKLFLNRFTSKLTQSQFKMLLLTILAVSQFSWSGTLLESLATGLRVLAIGIFYFLLGGYIARYNPFKNLRAYALILAIAAAYAVRFLSQYNIVSESIDSFIKAGSAGVLNFKQSVQGCSNYAITAVIIVICIFELFRRLKIQNNAVINFAAKSTFMIYLIHDNDFYRSIFRNSEDWIGTLSDSCLLYCLKWFKWALITFAVGLAAYGLYTLLGKLLPRIRSWFVVQEPSE